MQLRRLLVEDDAVSPVLGAVLMVAIAVVMMTTVGAFVLGYGPGEQPPRAELAFAQDSGPEVTINVKSTDGLFEEDVEVVVDSGSGTEPACLDGSWPGSGSIEVGTGPTVTGHDTSSPCSTTNLSSDDRILVIWESDSGDRSEIIGSFTVI